MDYFCGVSDDNAMWRNIKINKGQWCDQHVLTYSHIPDDHRIRAYPTASVKGRSALSFAAVLVSDDDSRAYIHIFSKPCLRIDDDSAAVTDIKTLADLSPRRDLYVRLVGQKLELYSIEQL